MKKYEDFIAGLKQDADPPKSVMAKYTEALDNIEQLAGQKKGEIIMSAGRKVRGNTWIKAAVVAGAFIAGGSIFALSNPVAASKLPIIGRIFESVEDDITYSGDYSAKNVLQDKTDPEPVLAEDNGITITASEVYSDGYSVYLAAEIKSEKGGFNNIPSHYTRRFEETVSQSVFAGGTWSVDGGKEEHLSNSYFEGKAVDDHTFIGMMKLDQQQYSEADGTLNLKISDIYYDDISEEVSESIEPANRFGGAWNLSVPYSVDKQHCREISVNQKNKDGYGIEKVFVSPYQVIVFSDVPSEQYYEQYEVAVFDQDQQPLEIRYGYQNKTIFAVQGREITKLHIYMSDELTFDLIKAVDENEAAQAAIFDVQLEL